MSAFERVWSFVTGRETAEFSPEEIQRHHTVFPAVLALERSLRTFLGANFISQNELPPIVHPPEGTPVNPDLAPTLGHSSIKSVVGKTVSPEAGISESTPESIEASPRISADIILKQVIHAPDAPELLMRKDFELAA